MLKLGRLEQAQPLLRAGAVLPDLFAATHVSALWCLPGHVFLTVQNGLLQSASCSVERDVRAALIHFMSRHAPRRLRHQPAQAASDGQRGPALPRMHPQPGQVPDRRGGRNTATPNLFILFWSPSTSVKIIKKSSFDWRIDFFFSWKIVVSLLCARVFV